jgi:hypothetical protein
MWYYKAIPDENWRWIKPSNENLTTKMLLFHKLNARDHAFLNSVNAFRDAKVPIDALRRHHQAPFYVRSSLCQPTFQQQQQFLHLQALLANFAQIPRLL